MATITASTTYPDGNPLDVAGHNANLASETSGEGILSEPNGGLEAANLDATFEVTRELVGPGEAVRTFQDGMVLTREFTSDLFPGGTGEVEFVPIAGLSLRFRLPYDVSAVLWMWSAFVNSWRLLGGVDDGQGNITWTEGPDVLIRAYLDGVKQDVTTRGVPVTAYHVDGQGIFDVESRATRQFDMHLLSESLSAGTHSLTVKLYMAAYGQVRSVLRDIGGNTVTSNHTVHHRVDFGISNIRAISFI